ncbi:hypothetical protein ABZX85_10370 [Streptomyces sp. NPDC004539]|uniref:hypothetical protein n=1 Tax=Streptomyces sp. NPDC004539 TaxID=3154280 RepID=UPI0033B54C04
MATEVNGMVECRPLARVWGEEDEDVVWWGAVDLFLLNSGNAYDALACLFGVRNSFGFRPLAEGRGLPGDVSEGVREQYYGEAYGATWISWAELEGVDWEERNVSGELSRGEVAGVGTHWGPVWEVMRVLGGVHGSAHVRLVVWFC